MEKDDNVKGEGNSINYKYRMHDPIVGLVTKGSTDSKSLEYITNQTLRKGGDVIEAETISTGEEP
ncbi:hypothetical protein ERX46_13115 [Brumimicrobium glaciale]|uniref:Uncharacterized protein n=1 Tax=Brumimicrobium glaciale TaxID=200475 RepID=A0A4Q4KIJ2_9FLAO|nr:hypothetical protein [Brumimicrobium glaciale]RYM32985.1 hypothetical protein ERX46_13115 [Brumimicrobium glaciale]